MSLLTADHFDVTKIIYCFFLPTSYCVVCQHIPQFLLDAVLDSTVNRNAGSLVLHIFTFVYQTNTQHSRLCTMML